MSSDRLPLTSMPPPVPGLSPGVPLIRLNSTESADTPVFHGPSQLGALIAKQKFFADLTTEQVHFLSGIATVVDYASDEWIFRENDPASRFFVVLKGYVSIEVDSDSGGTMAIRTLGPGDDLGWAWLFAPYRMHFNARATGPVRAIQFYGTRLREKCEEDHELGFQLMRRVAEVLVRTLKVTETLIYKGPAAGAVNSQNGF